MSKFVEHDEPAEKKRVQDKKPENEVHRHVNLADPTAGRVHSGTPVKLSDHNHLPTIAVEHESRTPKEVVGKLASAVGAVNYPARFEPMNYDRKSRDGDNDRNKNARNRDRDRDDEREKNSRSKDRDRDDDRDRKSRNNDRDKDDRDRKARNRDHDRDDDRHRESRNNDRDKDDDRDRKSRDRERHDDDRDRKRHDDDDTARKLAARMRQNERKDREHDDKDRDRDEKPRARRDDKDRGHDDKDRGHDDKDRGHDDKDRSRDKDRDGARQTKGRADDRGDDNKRANAQNDGRERKSRDEGDPEVRTRRTYKSAINSRSGDLNDRNVSHDDQRNDRNRERGHESKGDGRESKIDRHPPKSDGREPKGDGRESKADGREPKGDGREPKGGGREPRGDGREHKGDGREHRDDGREHRGDGREHRGDGREHRGDGRESRGDGREHRGDGRESKGDTREPKGEGRSNGPRADSGPRIPDHGSRGQSVEDPSGTRDAGPRGGERGDADHRRGDGPHQGDGRAHGQDHDHGGERHGGTNGGGRTSGRTADVNVRYSPMPESGAPTNRSPFEVIPGQEGGGLLSEVRNEVRDAIQVMTELAQMNEAVLERVPRGDNGELLKLEGSRMFVERRVQEWSVELETSKKKQEAPFADEQLSGQLFIPVERDRGEKESEEDALPTADRTIMQTVIQQAIAQDPNDPNNTSAQPTQQQQLQQQNANYEPVVPTVGSGYVGPIDPSTVLPTVHVSAIDHNAANYTGTATPQVSVSMAPSYTIPTPPNAQPYIDPYTATMTPASIATPQPNVTPNPANTSAPTPMNEYGGSQPPSGSSSSGPAIATLTGSITESIASSLSEIFNVVSSAGDAAHHHHSEWSSQNVNHNATTNNGTTTRTGLTATTSAANTAATTATTAIESFDNFLAHVNTLLTDAGRHNHAESERTLTRVLENTQSTPTHRIQDGQTLEEIAEQHYGDARYAELIFRMNMKQIPAKFVGARKLRIHLIPNMTLRLPTQQQFTEFLQSGLFARRRVFEYEERRRRQM